MTLAEGQRSQDVSTAAYPNHKHGRWVSQVVCKRRHVVFEMFHGAEISVEFRDHGCRTGVDIQIKLSDLSIRVICRAQAPSKWLASQFSYVDARKCVPFFIESVVRIPTAFEPLNIDELDGLINGTQREQQPTTASRYPSRFSIRRPSKRRECRDTRIQNHSRRRVDMVQDRNRQDATGRGPGKIGRIQCTCVPGKTCEGYAYNHPPENKGNRRQNESQSCPGDLFFRIDGYIQLRGETDSARQSEKQAKVGKHRVRFALLHQLDENRPGSETKHRQ